MVKVREILTGMSRYRVEQSRVKTRDTPTKTGSRGRIFAGAVFSTAELVAWIWPPTASTGCLEMKYAIRKLDWDTTNAGESAQLLESFVHELSLMETLSHPSIIRLVGFVEDMPKGDAWIIVPWEANGNVREFLQSGEWDIPERVSLIKDVVSGLKYLHTRQPTICHGDLKSSNILVNSSYRAVISDFGAARTKSNGKAMETEDWSRLFRPLYTLRWAAPEVLSGEEPDLPSDIWTVGWICWEIVTGRIPFDGVQRDTTIILHIKQGPLPLIVEDGRLSQVLQLCGLMSDCWLADPAERIDVSAFCRKVRFVPSTTPSGCSPGVSKVRSATLLLALGRMYGLQNNGAMAEAHYKSALDATSEPHDNIARADAMIGLGEIFNNQSRHREAEKAFSDARKIHSRSGNDLGTANTLVGMGGSYNACSRYQEAEKAFKESYDIYFRIGSNLGTANALVGLGQIYNVQSKFQEADEAFRTAHETHSRIGNDLGVANTLVGLGESYTARSRYQEAKKAFKQAREIHSRVGNDLGAANALIGLGQIYNVQSRYQDAEKALGDAHETHSRIGNDLGAANALVALGESNNAQLKYHEAEKAFKSAWEIFSRVGSSFGVASALVGMGESYRAQSRYQEAEEALKKSFQIHSRIGHKLGAAKVLLGLGQLYNVQSRFQEAEETFKKAKETHSRIGNDPGIANALVGLGGSYNARSKYQEAEEAFMESYSIHSGIGNNLGVASALMGLGQIYNVQSKLQEAEKAFEKALEIHSRIGNDLGVANTLVGLGESYTARSRYQEAENAFRRARGIHTRVGNDLGAAETLVALGESDNAQLKDQEAEKASKAVRGIHFRIGNDLGAANALLGLGQIHSIQSRYQDAETAFRNARDIYSRVGNGLGTANALVVLGESYNARSRYEEAEKACREAYQIYSRIGNDFGVASTLVGLGKSYTAQSRYLEAKKAFKEAGQIYSHIGSELGAADALVGLGEIYSALSKHSGAEKAFGEALEIYSRIGNDFGAANALIGLGEVYNDLSKDREAKETFGKALELHSVIGNQVGIARAGILLGEAYNTQLKHTEANDAFKDAVGTLSRIQEEIGREHASNNLEDDTQSNYSTDEEAKEDYSRMGHNATVATALDDLDYTHVDLSPTSFNDPSNSLQLPTEPMDDDPQSSQAASEVDTPPNSRGHEQGLSDEFTATAHAPAPATEELVDLLQALGEAAPNAVRNKHKIYSILQVSRDICNRIMEIGEPHECQSNSDILIILTRMEDYEVLLDALEETLLQLAAILPSEIRDFGTDLYSSWPLSRSTLAGILRKLDRPPFSTISSHTQNITDDLFYDDCSWLSRLLHSGIQPKISTQFLDIPKTHPVLAVISGLEYLETQVKSKVPKESTRVLIIDIATSLAQTLASTSPKDGSGKSLQGDSSSSAEADRDWLVRALANSFSMLDLDSTLERSTAKELAKKWADIQREFSSRRRGVSGNQWELDWS